MAWDFPGHDDNTHVWHNYEGHVSNVGVWKETVAISAKSSDWFVEYSSGIRRDWDNKCTEAVAELQDDVMTWKRFRRYWPFVRGIHRSPVDSPHKGPVNVFAQAKCWTNSGVAVDVMHHDAHITSLWCISYGQRKCIPKLSIMEETLEKTCMLIFVVKSVCWIYIYIYLYIYLYIYVYVHTPAVSWRAGLLWSQRDFEWRWSVPLFKCLTVLEFSFILFDLCLLITFFNFIMNYVPIVTFWIFTYHKIWILSIMFCSIWSYWIIYFLACLEVSWRVVS